MKTDIKSAAAAFLRAFLAGVSIGIGGTVFLSCDNKYVGSFLFAIGLFLIFSYGLNLFTGKVGYLFENSPTYILFLALVWIGNFAGTFFVAKAVSLTRIFPDIGAKALAICRTKTSDNPISIFILAFFCGLMMYLAADGYKKADDLLRKYLSVFLPVMIFILSGFEHCVANMYYYSLNGLFGAGNMAYLLIMTIGNALGSFLFPITHMLLRITEK